MIKRLFYVEFYKATHNNKYFWWTIIVGSALAFVEAIQTLFEVSPIVKNLLCLPEIYHSFNGISLFYLWNGVVTLHGASAVENAIWPLLCGAAFGWSYWQEGKNGVMNQVLIRGGRWEYYIAKYAVTFLIGGFVTVVPFIGNLVIEATFLPAIVPAAGDGISPINNSNVFSYLYYSYPWLFCLLWSTIVFFWGGVVSCTCLLVGDRPKHKVWVIFLPFFILMGIEIIITISGLSRSPELSPIRLLVSGNDNRGWIVIIELSVFLIISFIGGLIHVLRKEI